MTSTPTDRTGAAPHYAFLDVVRAGAAFLVLLGHARYFFMPSFQEVTDAGPATMALYFLSGLQHEAVVLFFVISGYLVGGAVWERLSAGSFQAGGYLFARFSRIFLVFLPALALTLIVAALLGGPLAATPIAEGRPVIPFSLALAACHLAGLQGLYCSVVVENPPLWSLGYEWFLYLLAPCTMALLVLVLRNFCWLLAVPVFAGLLITVLPAHTLWYWLGFWYLGALAKAVAPRCRGRWVAVLSAAGLAAVTGGFVLSRLHVAPVMLTDGMVAGGLALALLHPGLIGWSPAPRLFGHLADMSYSLYAIHYPVLLLTVAVLQSVWGGVGGWVQMGGALAICIAAAWGFAAVTEHRNEAVRRMLLRAYKGRR